MTLSELILMLSLHLASWFVIGVVGWLSGRLILGPTLGTILWFTVFKPYLDWKESRPCR